MQRFEILASSDRSRPEPAKAWDHVFRRAAAVKRFPANLSPSSSGKRLMGAWERWMTAPHPTFLRPAILDFRMGWLVREWAPGFTLLELLRARRKLTARETLSLLQSAPAVLDHAAAHGLLPEIGLDKFFVRIEADEGSDLAGTAVKESLDRWPRWSLRVEPLRLSSHLPSAEGQTAIGRVPLPAGIDPAVAALRHFLRELSGGSLSRPDAPVAAFNGPANNVLATALRRGGFETAKSLFDALVESCPDDAPSPRDEPPQLPARSIPPAHSDGGILLLEPVKGTGRPMKLVTRSELKLGRSETQADVVARFLGDTEQASEMAKRLSRVHARVIQRDGGLWLLDGSGAAASQNGTWVGDGPISSDPGVALPGMLAARLGSHWIATMLPVPRSGDGTSISRQADGSGNRWGAVFFVPWPGCAVACETVWLIEEAGFGIDANGVWVWDTEALESAPAAIRTEGGGFVLCNRRLDASGVTVNGSSVLPGEQAALQEGAVVAVGKSEWHVRIS